MSSILKTSSPFSCATNPPHLKYRYLLILHESLVAARPQPPRVAVDDVSEDNLPVGIDAKLDLHIDQRAVAGRPGAFQHLEDDARRAEHYVVLVLADCQPVELEASIDHLLLRPLWVVVRVVLEEGLLQGWVETVALWYA